MANIKQIEVDNVTYDIEDSVARSNISNKADANSPALTGTPTAPTAASGTNTTQIATTAFVQTAMQDVGKVKSVNGQTGDVTITKASVGLGNVENTKIAPVSKTTDMTQSVGIDSDGKLYTESTKDGVTPNIQIGTVTTLDAGSGATASMSGTAENPLLNLGIPKGKDGAPGAAGQDGVPAVRNKK